MRNYLREKCAAELCDKLARVWTYSPRAKGLVPACRGHHLDLCAGGSTVDDGAPVLNRGRCVA